MRSVVNTMIQPPPSKCYVKIHPRPCVCVRGLVDDRACHEGLSSCTKGCSTLTSIVMGASRAIHGEGPYDSKACTAVVSRNNPFTPSCSSLFPLPPCLAGFRQIPSRLFDEMPCIWLKPAKKEDDDGSAAKTYNCPLYKTSLRVSERAQTAVSAEVQQTAVGRVTDDVPLLTIYHLAAVPSRLGHVEFMLRRR